MQTEYINIPGFGPVGVDELQKDVIAAKARGFSRMFAFTPETVQGLIDKVKELTEEKSK